MSAEAPVTARSRSGSNASRQLVAVLTQLDEEVYSTKGKWFLETGFWLLIGQRRSFDTVEEAVRWVAEHMFYDRTVDRSAIFAAGR
ncbi:MAG: hypothetical protein EOQ42_11695 [Mesorhizobium sp.]|nr:MAG: hypothetical protein EOQ43_12005 [Mesorhizobium sp.]TGU00670.1 hypothetical protein EN807_12970 [Mesorhizobium sp. M5C.F.Ca.ET.164.01.1.1]RWB71251.1 MAG: hypothetical protein EOQ42_11695 [Mesorhizobium sp.]RWC24833.1 MAG: hypothetical protein EOS51_02360 [Mesorhizobium sp.]RWD19712.1 MAG: hypothetical protein EOS57_11685 [Mesorhizobium sp.]